MTLETVTIELSRTEMDYLCSAGFLESQQIDTLRAVAQSSDVGVVLRLPRDSVEEFRDAFTEQLAKVGFDENYDLTPEGKMLEDLIDRFFLA
ncbi:hypothetical protein [Methylocaldum sp. GT1TLB]|jgi:hypothetical protein|uniref:hypothetical protein n=1 Tax=unclassified Methylocaldum TaxID=2622260 RepID=UPI003DA08037